MSDRSGFQSPRPSHPSVPNQPSSSKLSLVIQQTQDIQSVMKDNMSKAIERGNNLEELETKTNTLSENANKFAQAARKLKCFFIRKNIRNIVIILFILLVFILLVVWVSGGFK